MILNNNNINKTKRNLKPRLKLNEIAGKNLRKNERHLIKRNCSSKLQQRTIITEYWGSKNLSYKLLKKTLKLHTENWLLFIIQIKNRERLKLKLKSNFKEKQSLMTTSSRNIQSIKRWSCIGIKFRMRINVLQIQIQDINMTQPYRLMIQSPTKVMKSRKRTFFKCKKK